MRRIILIFAVLLTAITANAQDKKLDNVRKLFENKSFTECIEAARKYNSTNSSKPEIFFYIGFSYLELYKQNPQKESQLSSAENSVFQALSKDKSGEVRKNFSENLDELHKILVDLSTKYFESDDKTKAGQHSSMLAKIYNDTTEVYRRIYNPEMFLKPIGKSLAAYEGPTNQYDVTGQKIGVWIEKFPNGKRKSQINYENGKPRGDFYKFYQKTGGVSAQLHFFDDNLASAILYAENGDKIAMGYYYNQKKDSLWQFFEGDSLLVAEEFYSKGVKQGVQTTYYIFGFPSEEITYKDGKKDGPWKRYYESSTLEFEAVYVNGELNGPYKKYDIKGNVIMQGNYKNDLPDGEWMVWDAEKNKKTTIKYKNGVPENDEAIKEAEAQEILKMIDNKGKFEEPAKEMNSRNIYFDN